MDVNHYRKNVDSRLLIRQRIFLLIITGCLLFGISNVLTGKINFFLALGGFLSSTILGLLMSRMFKISWHTEKAKVVAQLDALGIALLVLYIGLELGREWIFSHWFSGTTLSAFTLAIITGLLLGRFLGTGLLIHSVLNEKKP